MGAFTAWLVARQFKDRDEVKWVVKWVLQKWEVGEGGAA